MPTRPARPKKPQPPAANAWVIPPPELVGAPNPDWMFRRRAPMREGLAQLAQSWTTIARVWAFRLNEAVAKQRGTSAATDKTARYLFSYRPEDTRPLAHCALLMVSEEDGLPPGTTPRTVQQALNMVAANPDWLAAAIDPSDRIRLAQWVGNILAHEAKTTAAPESLELRLVARNTLFALINLMTCDDTTAAPLFEMRARPHRHVMFGGPLEWSFAETPGAFSGMSRRLHLFEAVSRSGHVRLRPAPSRWTPAARMGVEALGAFVDAWLPPVPHTGRPAYEIVRPADRFNQETCLARLLAWVALVREDVAGVQAAPSAHPQHRSVGSNPWDAVPLDLSARLVPALSRAIEALDSDEDERDPTLSILGQVQSARDRRVLCAAAIPSAPSAPSETPGPLRRRM